MVAGSSLLAQLHVQLKPRKIQWCLLNLGRVSHLQQTFLVELSNMELYRKPHWTPHQNLLQLLGTKMPKHHVPIMEPYRFILRGVSLQVCFGGWC
jgi:hypothetical protein